MIKRNRFFLDWMILNPIGFTLGSLHGATDHGFVPSVIPGYIGLVLGDLVFGGMVGIAQYIAFKRANFLPASIYWILANSLGFTFGARAGALLTFRITDEWMLAGVIFGIFMGVSIGLTTAITLFKQFSPARLFAWIFISTAAWIAGEGIAFASFFSIKTVPLVGLAIAGFTWLGLACLQSQPQIRNLVQAEQ